MDIEPSIMNVITFAIAIATFFLGRMSAANENGQRSGQLATDIEYIKKQLDKIDSSMDKNINNLNGRVDEISAQLIEISKMASKADQSSKSAHNRIDEHLNREHQITTRHSE